MGQWIRNEWNLWVGGELKDWFIKNEINHPDDISGIILRSYYRYKNGLNINLYEQFEKTINFYLTNREKLVRNRKLKLKNLKK